METQIIRSDRKTLSMELRGETLIVRAPRHMSEAVIRQFIRDHEGWIAKARAKQERAAARTAGVAKLTAEELEELADAALADIPERVRRYAGQVGVTYGRITIRAQRTRWGSCSAAGNLNFNCLLMLAPPEVRDSVVVHELCHRKEMNHSRRFYAEVYRVFPEYDRWHGWLNEHGAALQARLP